MDIVFSMLFPLQASTNIGSLLKYFYSADKLLKDFPALQGNRPLTWVLVWYHLAYGSVLYILLSCIVLILFRGLA